MATIEKTWQPLIEGTPSGECELPQILIDELFAGGRGWAAKSSRNVRPSSEWVRVSFAPGVLDAAAEETVFHSDEVTREAISSASRPVVIEITDAQAEQLKQFRGGGTGQAE